MLTGKPVKWIEDRSENLQADSFARDYHMTTEIAATKEGDIRAYEVDCHGSPGVGGGATVVREYLRAGLVDQLHVAIVPILLGRGIRLWDDLRGLESGYQVKVEAAPLFEKQPVRFAEIAGAAFVIEPAELLLELGRLGGGYPRLDRGEVRLCPRRQHQRNHRD